MARTFVLSLCAVAFFRVRMGHKDSPYLRAVLVVRICLLVKGYGAKRLRKEFPANVQQKAT